MLFMRSVYRNRRKIAAGVAVGTFFYEKQKTNYEVLTGKKTFVEGIRANTHGLLSESSPVYRHGSSMYQVATTEDSPYEQLREEYPYVDHVCRQMDASTNEVVKQKVDDTVKEMKSNVSASVNSMGQAAQISFHQISKEIHTEPRIMSPFE